jgi:AcrR family transcriptional regulator
MALKTRDKLIEVARQLFARKGVENTTMLDIANASDKGRRTIYTYFKNKREIHQAVIERESNQIVSRQRQILDSEGSATEKLRQFMEARFQILICPTGRHDQQETSVPRLLRLDVKRSEKTRRLAAKKEIEILKQILKQGADNGEFSTHQANRALALIITLMQGVDSPTIAANLEDAATELHTAQTDLIDFIIAGIQPRGNSSDDQPAEIQ